MRLAAFCYGFPHEKTCAGLSALVGAGFKPQVAILAPWRPLAVPRSELPVAIGAVPLFWPEPSVLCANMEIDYAEMAHEDCAELLADARVTHGVVLGARILPRDVIEAVPGGILNMHPGILPENRGLDNIKQAVLHGIPQGVTAHLIDPKVDRGWLIAQERIAVYPGDRLTDFAPRIKALEFRLMLDACEKLARWHAQPELRPVLPRIGKGNLFTALSPDEEDLMLRRLPAYTEDFAHG